MPLSTYRIQKNAHHDIQYKNGFWARQAGGFYFAANDPFYKRAPQDYKLAQLEALKQTLGTRDIELMEDGSFRTYPYVFDMNKKWYIHIGRVSFFRGWVYLYLSPFDLYDKWPAWYFTKPEASNK